MNAHRIALLASVSAVFAFACSLNPQPLPPDTPDGSFGADVGTLPQNDASSFGDSAMPPPNDSGVGNLDDASDSSDERDDASDRDADASDGGDASDGDASDASELD